jgi:hypothetical protein
MARAKRTCVELIRTDDGNDRLCPIVVPAGQSRCPPHLAEFEARRGTRQQRGYDQKHDRMRKRLLPRAYGKSCPLCNEVMEQADDLDLDHTIPLWQNSASQGDRIVHRSCNQKRPKHPTR